MYNILLVDDDKVVRYHLKKMDLWKELGFSISNEAIDGYDALQKVASSHFDAALVDIKMPRVDGIEFLKELRENKNNLCVIFMSRHSDFAYARQGIVLGAFDYILKPVEETGLSCILSRTKHFLDEKKLESELHVKLSGLFDENLAAPPSFDQKTASVIGKLYLDNENPVVRQLCKYVLLHCDEKVTLESISSELGYSSSYLGRIFKQKMGESFVEYVTKVKMERAKVLLRTGKYKNFEISEILGYSEVDYFSSLFKKYTGVTPMDYRQSPYPQR